jgi:hypothetical protein
MEGDVMQKLSWMLLLLGLAPLSLGCNKSSAPEQTTSHGSAVEGIAQEERAIKLRAKREIDEITEEAEAAVRKARARVKTAAEKKSADLSAFAVQIAEDAKDRAVDIPDMVDQALERHTRRFHENRRTTKQAENRDDEDDWWY